ncbi:hypothetical protein [Rubritalea tangerina]|uniref:Uncharacterized protein n=1 Tax=Rubritalea tangerina TaxID=430798 RepID=A0ABW4ZE63_9BACT
MTSPQQISSSAQALLDAVQANPSDWANRKEAAYKLYQEGFYLEAADTVWNAPEMPSTDMDVAFAVKIVSRARPNRSIRLVYEVLRRNTGKAEQNMAMARAFNLIGLPMLASRFYGAAMADGAKHFDIGFEQQSLWYDDSESLMQAWEASSSELKPPFTKPVESFLGHSINFSDLTEDMPVVSPVTGPVTSSVSKPAGLSSHPVLKAAKPTAATPVRPATPAPAKKMPRPSAPLSPQQSKPAPKPPTPAAPNAPKNAPKPMLPPMEDGDKA